MRIKDILEFNRLTPEQVFYLGDIERRYKIANVDIICLTGQIGVLAELAVYNAKKLYVAFEATFCYEAIFYDENLVSYNTKLQNKQILVESWIGNLSDDLTIGSTQEYQNIFHVKNLMFSCVNNLPIKFIGLRITLQ